MAGALLMETKHLNVMLSKWNHQNHNELGKHSTVVNKEMVNEWQRLVLL